MFINAVFISVCNGREPKLYIILLNYKVNKNYAENRILHSYLNYFAEKNFDGKLLNVYFYGKKNIKHYKRFLNYAKLYLKHGKKCAKMLSISGKWDYK